MGQGASKVERNKRSCFFFSPLSFFFSKNKKKKAVGGDFFFYLDGGPPRRLIFQGVPTEGVWSHDAVPTTPPLLTVPCELLCYADKIPGKKIESRAKPAQIPALKRWRRRGDGGCTRQPNSLWDWGGGDTVPHPSNRAVLLSVMVCKCLKIIKYQTSSTPLLV